MRRFLPTVVVLVVLAAAAAPLAQAQGRADKYPETMGITGPPPVPATIASLVLDRAADLKLADSQRVAVEAIRRVQDSVNFPRLRALDSLRPTRRPANGPNDLSPEQREEADQRRAAIVVVLDALHETNSATRNKVLALLNPDQQRKATDWENDARKKAEKEGEKRVREAFDTGGMRGRRPQED